MSDGRGLESLARGFGRRALLPVAPLAVALLLSGCPTGWSSAPTPGGACVERYAKCRLPDGPLGVCSDVPCEEGQTEPCLRCVSQH
jgi:hypothetical protein